MEKRQSELCFEILRRFNKVGILKDFILIGSWCAYFYNEYFSGTPYLDRVAIKTRDIDFLIDNPAGIKEEVDIPELLRDLGFVVVFKGRKGYVKLEHPDLLLEFLVPEKGRGTDKPYPLPKLGVNAASLRFLIFLSSNTIKVKVEDFNITLPHPANFSLHKLIIFQRRPREDKATKDKVIALEILRALIRKSETDAIIKAYKSVPTKWQAKIVKGLTEAGGKEILEAIGKQEK